MTDSGGEGFGHEALFRVLGAEGVEEFVGEDRVEVVAVERGFGFGLVGVPAEAEGIVVEDDEVARQREAESTLLVHVGDHDVDGAQASDFVGRETRGEQVDDGAESFAGIGFRESS